MDSRLRGNDEHSLDTGLRRYDEAMLVRRSHAGL